MISKEEAKKSFNKLTQKEEQYVFYILNNIINDYQRLIGVPLDLPYYFYSTYRVMFVDMHEYDINFYLDIDNSLDFSVYTIYIISEYIIKSRKV